MAAAAPIEILEPTPAAMKAARRARGLIAEAAERVTGQGGNQSVRLEEIDLPVSVLRLIDHILGELAEGRTVAVQAFSEGEEEATTSQAARVLGMSRPTLVGLLKQGKIRYRMVGSHRRIPLSAILEYRHQTEHAGAAARTPSREERAQGLREMAEFTNSLGLGY
jgi:excisionase family DNA binding protein